MRKVLLIAPMSSVHERFNIANFSALEANGFEVSVIANFSLCDHDKQYKKELENKGIELFDLPFQRASLLKNLKLIPEIKKIIKNGGFDIVHAHTETGGILTRLSVSADKNAEYFYTPHGMSFYKGSSLKSQLIYRPIERFICGKMAKVFCINEEEYETVKAWKKGNEVFVHGIGLDLDSVINAENKDEISKSSLMEIFENPKSVCNDETKISSYEPHLMTMLKLTPKVISQIKQMAPDVTLVGFKLLEGVSKEELYEVASRLRQKNKADFIVANDLAKIGNGKHWAMILNKDGIVKECNTKKEIATALEELLF